MLHRCGPALLWALEPGAVVFTVARVIVTSKRPEFSGTKNQTSQDGWRGSKRAGAVATAEATERFALPIKDKVRWRAELE